MSLRKMLGGVLAGRGVVMNRFREEASVLGSCRYFSGDTGRQNGDPRDGQPVVDREDNKDDTTHFGALFNTLHYLFIDFSS